MAKNGFFDYICIYYDEFKNTTIKVHGIIYSNTYANAIQELEKCYDSIERIAIEGLEPGPPIYEIGKNDEQKS